VGLLVGLVTGYLLAQDEPDPLALVADVRADVRAAAELLDVAKVEYRESVSDGEVASVREYGGARDALGRSRARFDRAARVLEPLDHRAAAQIDNAYERLGRMMGETAPSHDVIEAIEGLSSRLGAIANPG
jgi:hypothetical protein